MSAARGLWLLVLAVALAANFGYWWEVGRPHALHEAPTGKFACVSYTPFRGTESPFDRHLMVSPERIDEDLARVASIADCVRTYATDQGLAAVPGIAERHGLQVLLGIWIGRNPEANRQQIDTAIALARAYPAAVRAIIVGNEVLLRGEQSAATLAKLLREVKAATGKPVTYADVWEFWLRAPQELAAAADFLTVHVLPYWEDDPVAASEGVAHLEEVLAKVNAAFPGKPILIGETGWPTAGRERSAAVPGRLEQASYIRSFLAYTAARGLDYNLIEAFDQPWKRQLEGTVGGQWGLLDAERREKLAPTGPISAEPEWQMKAAAATLLGLLLLAGHAGSLWRGRSLRTALLPPIAIAAGTLLVLAAGHSILAARNTVDIAIEGGLLVLSALISWELMGRIADPEPLRPVAIAELVADLRKLGTDFVDPAGRLPLLQVFAVAGALCTSLGLVFDARYRDFPIDAFALPAIGLAADAFLRRDWLQQATDRTEEALFSALLIGSACWIVVKEGPANWTALIWAVITVLLALPWIGAWQGLRRGWRPGAIAAAAQ